MSTKVNIRIKSKIVYDNGEKETINEKYTGTIFEKNSAYYLRYQENSEQQFGKTWTIVKWNKFGLPLELSIIRQGDITMNQVFREGYQHRSHYRSPYGKMEIEVYTQKLSFQNKATTGGEILLEYEMKANNQFIGRYQLEIDYLE
ncbi:hypothetical protein BHF71_01430 [Vulcanibacillus modesticaldus]|uniref:DUF1934 domain-containing protein n=1 Tax=Vulcanibacillus modesticaldus TaxID=337097 RepID=A0A1D2YVW4_9BACI|nr:DUF1934 domain-containing protein [Vulcanibacillus modesticaldus]OEF99864.1 hypothetical protein BHF71_01430 [Vulcanibacillus modesticaldus]